MFQRECKGRQEIQLLCFPLFPQSVIHVILDSLHMFMHICDQLVSQLVDYLQTCDNITKSYRNKVKILSLSNILLNLKISFTVLASVIGTLVLKDGKLTYRPFTGVEYGRVLNNLALEQLIPKHKKLCDICDLWQNFKWILGQ